MNFKNSLLLLRSLLTNGENLEWQYQGLGMIRLHLGTRHRLHIWDRSLAVPDVSTIHDHLQWGLNSTILVGQMINQRYTQEQRPGSIMFQHARIKACEGGGIEQSLGMTFLHPCEQETYYPGNCYFQEPDEIHESIPYEGTVTLMAKTPTNDRDGARVFWRKGDWVSAEPRPATNREICQCLNKALALLERQRTLA